MSDVTTYTSLIPSENASLPNFMAMVGVTVQPFVDMLTVSNSISFDVDTAVGLELDFIGQWVGLSRYVETPLPSVYFSFDTVGLGFDEGSIFYPTNPTEGLSALDDETYRALIYSKMESNRWDGSVASLQTILNDLFLRYGSTLFAIDNFNMSVTVYVTGATLPAILVGYIRAGYLTLKPAGVGMSFEVASTPGAPVFGFDVETSYISGFDVGSFAIPL